MTGTFTWNLLADIRDMWAYDAMVNAFRAGTIVAVGFFAKGAKKSSVAIEHSKLPDRESANRIKEYWSGRFNVLRNVLATG